MSPVKSLGTLMISFASLGAASGMAIAGAPPTSIYLETVSAPTASRSSTAWSRRALRRPATRRMA